MKLTLEIAEGSKYDNLENEIEKEYQKNYKKAQKCFLDGYYEKSIQHYHNCLIIDPDHRIVNIIEYKLEKIINSYFKELYSCAYKSFNCSNHEVSRYYFTKCYCLLVENGKYMKQRNINQLKKIEDMLNSIQRLMGFQNHMIDINHYNLYKIKL